MKAKVTLSTGLLLVALPLFAPIYMNYLRIDGIDGSSKDPAHHNWIELDSFSFGAPQPSAGMNTIGGVTGRAEHGEFVITKTVDSASPTLFRYAASGKHFPSVTLDVNGQRFLLEDVSIKSVTKTAMGDGSVRETMTFVYGRDATHQAPPSVALTLKKASPAPNAMLNGDGMPSSITLRQFRMLDATHGMIVVCDTTGGNALGGLQRAFQSKQKMQNLTISTNPGARGSNGELLPAVRLAFTDATISGNRALTGGCSEMSLNFTRYTGPTTFEGH